jgi:hypothetical protein
MATFNSFAVSLPVPIAGSQVSVIWGPQQNVPSQALVSAGGIFIPWDGEALSEPSGDSSIPPVIEIAAPAEGTVISRFQPLGFDVRANEIVRDLARVIVTLLRGGEAIEEMIHDGVAFSSTFTGGVNLRQDITNGYRYTFLRTGGWHGSTVTIRIIAIDSLGTVAVKTVGDPRVLYTWLVAVG